MEEWPAVENPLCVFWRGARACGGSGRMEMDAPQPPDHVQYAPYSQRTREVVAATLIHEAGGEGTLGMKAVLSVILNRAGGDPHKAAAVCLVPFAFSPWNNKAENRVIDSAREHPCWYQALMLAELGLQGKIPDVTGGADHFYDHKRSNPPWARKMVRTKVIGGHVFLKGK